jgi:uncharacterized protein YndB with AHSA1/START domain
MSAVPDIVHQIHIAAPPADVYRALSEEDGLKAWWTADVEIDPDLGGMAEFGFDGRSTVFRMRVEELQPDEFVRWHCLGGHPEWEHTEITFDVSDEDGKTVLYFAHRGWESTDGILATCSYQWAVYLQSLKAFCETGTGTPHSGEAGDFT